MKILGIVPYYSYFLALQQCTKKSEYTIHGLWIDYTYKGYPSFCNKSLHFDIEKLDPIRSSLDKYWMSCGKNSNNEKFWNHEYKKHYSCFQHLEVFSELDYFNKTLQLYLSRKNDLPCKKKNCMIKIDNFEVYN